MTTKLAFNQIDGMSVSVNDYSGLVADGDWAPAIRAALATGAAEVVLPPTGSYAVESFSEVLDDGTECAFILTSNVRIVGGGVITSASASNAQAIFGLDATSGSIAVDVSDLTFTGANRYRALHGSTDASLSRLAVKGVTTFAQSFAYNGDISKSFKLVNSSFGVAIAAGTAMSPFVSIVFNTSNDFECLIDSNTLRTGTEVVASAIVLHYLPSGAHVTNNTHINIGQVATEGFDLDNLGSNTLVSGNTAIYSSYEYKVGSGGYVDSNNCLFTNNVSYESIGAAFSLRSTCIASNNIAYNPADYGFFLRDFGPTDISNSDNVWVQGSNNIVVWAGSSMTAAYAVGSTVGAGNTNFVQNVNFDGFGFYIDPKYKEDNPAAVLPCIGIDLRGDCANIRFANGKIDETGVANQVQLRDCTSGATNLTFENITHGDAGDSCYDLLTAQNVKILNPTFPATIADRPVRFSGVTVAQITCPYHASITFAQVSGGNSGVLINNWGQEAAGVGNPPSAGVEWPIGCTAENTDDNTVWLRKSVSAVPASAWIQLA
jgi:hypothetical protein